MATNYDLIDKQLGALIESETDLLAMSANMVGLLFAEVSDINWLGLYLLRGNDLVLGPFQGNPACVRIPLGQGVCGTAARNAQTIRTDDVHTFNGHIACDPESRSEIVVPLQADGKVFAVLDIDSPQKARFSQEDQVGIEKLCMRFVQRLAAIKSDLNEFI